MPVLDPEVETPAGDEKQRDNSPPRIRCPLCAWQPDAHSRWFCNCGHTWNTFDTGGICPACLYQWLITACLACHRWSAHSDWYEH
jgi:hypothetical protein